MSISLADHYGIPPDVFDQTGALDPILDVDTRLFIDPSLLRVATTPELQGSHDKLTTHFDNLLRVIKNIKTVGPQDLFWKRADKLLQFPELSGLCIGYAAGSTNGSGVGPQLRRQILATACELVQVGVDDPALFEIVGIFQDNMGPDRISDMVATIICEDLAQFTKRVCDSCGIPTEQQSVGVRHLRCDVPRNPATGKPLILVPKEVLRDLPTADDFGDVRWIAEHNETLREELNLLIGSSWKRVTAREQKAKLRQDFVRFPEVLKEVLAAYKEANPELYDFTDDRAGEVAWYRASRVLPTKAPLALSLPAQPTAEDVFKVVVKICEHFRVLVEDGQLARLLYDKNKRAKHESAAQLLFYGIASAYCKANDLDLTPEADAGRGPVDFKVSKGFDSKVLVEVKLTSNKNLAKGFTSQLPIYQRAEEARLGVYLVIDNGGAAEGRLKSFKQLIKDSGAKAPVLFWVDGAVRPSASKSEDGY